MKSGIFERFQSMPIARSGVLWAHVFTSLVTNLISLVIVVGVALLMGFRSGQEHGTAGPVRRGARRRGGRTWREVGVAGKRIGAGLHTD
jgi:hypothetical protein